MLVELRSSWVVKFTWVACSLTIAGGSVAICGVRAKVCIGCVMLVGRRKSAYRYVMIGAGCSVDYCRMKYSSDGKAWHNGVQVFASPLSWWKTYAPNMTTNDVWAPDLTYYNGRYYMFYSVSEFGKNNSAIGLVSCSSIAKGDWRDDGCVISSKSGVNAYNAIDPNLTIDASGKPWLVFGSWFDGLHVVRLSTTTWRPSGTIYNIANKSGGIEGASMIYQGGYYYLFASYGVCCQGVNSTYKIGYGRSTSITGPFVDKNGVNMSSGGVTYLDTGNAKWVGPGGEDVYKNGSNYLMVRHAYDSGNNGMATLLISDLYFTNGWPTY
jgi:arabinan endo-1,5-alpha-L-arabinosidase